MAASAGAWPSRSRLSQRPVVCVADVDERELHLRVLAGQLADQQLDRLGRGQAADIVRRAGHRNHLLPRRSVATMSEFQFLTCRSWPSRPAMRSEYMMVTGRADG